MKQYIDEGLNFIKEESLKMLLPTEADWQKFPATEPNGVTGAIKKTPQFV